MEAAFSNQHSPISEKQDHKDFTAKDAEDTEERKQNQHQRPFTAVEWKPTPDTYRMDTREGMEAYEASFRMKMKPWLDRAGTPPREAAPQEH